MHASITRRGLLALSALAAAARGLPAWAQPKSTVKLVVPFPAGGTADSRGPQARRPPQPRQAKNRPAARASAAGRIQTKPLSV